MMLNTVQHQGSANRNRKETPLHTEPGGLQSVGLQRARRDLVTVQRQAKMTNTERTERWCGCGGMGPSRLLTATQHGRTTWEQRLAVS